MSTPETGTPEGEATFTNAPDLASTPKPESADTTPHYDYTEAEKAAMQAESEKTIMVNGREMKTSDAEYATAKSRAAVPPHERTVVTDADGYPINRNERVNPVTAAKAAADYKTQFIPGAIAPEMPPLQPVTPNKQPGLRGLWNRLRGK